MICLQFRVSAAAAAALICFAQSGNATSLYSQTNLTSDISGLAANTDSNLKNPWGISFGPTTPFWVSDQKTNVTTLYSGSGSPVPLVPAVPGGPTGQVFNSDASSGAFKVSGTASLFLFATLSGSIDGWYNGIGPSALPGATTAGAAYTGLAIGTASGNDYLYAANSKGGVEVFDSTFGDVTGSTFAGKFVDPNLPAGYTTYNVQNIGGNIYVTYADLAAGAVLGNGFVDEFDSSGNLLQRIATGGALDEPWGITMAPASGFGTYSGDLLIGNFGNGWINAYSPSGAFLGSLDGVNGTPLVNNSLWALDFGNGGPGFSADTLYFTAGINNQQDGLFGEIQAVPEPGAAGTFAFGMMAILVAFRCGLAARAPR